MAIPPLARRPRPSPRMMALGAFGHGRTGSAACGTVVGRGPPDEERTGGSALVEGPPVGELLPYFLVSSTSIILNSLPLLGSLPNISIFFLPGPMVVITSRMETGFF